MFDNPPSMLNLDGLHSSNDVYVLQSPEGIIQVRNDLKGTSPDLSHPGWKVLYHKKSELRPYAANNDSDEEELADIWEDLWTGNVKSEIRQVIAGVDFHHGQPLRPQQ